MIERATVIQHAKQAARVTLALLATSTAMALTPCAPKPATEAALAKQSTWIFEGELTKRDDKKVPFVNCALEDKSQCAQQDVSTLTFKIKKWLKGSRHETQVSLSPALCSETSPTEIGAISKVYGRDARFFDATELLKTSKPAKTSN